MAAHSITPPTIILSYLTLVAIKIIAPTIIISRKFLPQIWNESHGHVSKTTFDMSFCSSIRVPANTTA
jgi:hypothetical protein